MTSRLPMPNIGTLLGPILPALPLASASSQPAIGVLPLLSPILRQRVQLLSDGSSDPWLALLTYDAAKAARLSQVVQSGQLEPHPVSNEVEVDWEYDAKTKYRRLDKETLQALVVLEHLELLFRLVYCVGDQDGGGDGWRVAEVGVAEKPDPFADFAGHSTIAEAEKAHEGTTNGAASTTTPAPTHLQAHAYEEDDEDDGYWDSYDKTPARSPVNKRSPAPAASSHNPSASVFGGGAADSAEDKYYAQYDDVQPAMDNYDPDEVVPGMEVSEPELQQRAPPLAQPQPVKPASPPSGGFDQDDRTAELLHPRPASSASSNGSRTVEKLEEAAERHGANELSIKQHVQRSIKSLYELSLASGMDRKEFERLVHTELDVFPLREGDNDD
ncbi:hypothetical protein F5X68DRAFT_276805 [Plectosphaerella plurivora]|uniref:Uncharacterized protein n=1 Tax=Plectosphaerella plurivora TaxID=936078 RepID=A0A9P8VAA6_9PEZI|nr:hypothetical protein F5X68DRAFT_276805 [Plectosphaerella plurivora]